MSARRRWAQHIVCEKSGIRTTWTFRFAAVVAATLLLALTRAWWVPGVGRTLVCGENVRPVDAILIENLDPNYLVFERAGELCRQGVASRFVVTTPASPDTGEPNLVSVGIVDVMARVARLRQPTVIPIREMEPISLHAAFQIRDYLLHERIRSVLVVTPAFRSRRSSLVYDAVFGKAGIETYCVPVFGSQTLDSWIETWHGMLQIAEQSVKFQYYRWYVLPFVSQRVDSKNRWSPATGAAHEGRGGC